MNDPLETTPVFYDATQRRRVVLTFFSRLVALLVFCAAVGVMVSIALNPALPQLVIRRAAASASPNTAGPVGQGRNHARAAAARLRSTLEAPATQPARSPADARARALGQFVLRRDQEFQQAKRRLNAAISNERSIASIPQSAISPGHISAPVRAVFYLNNEDKSGIESFAHHAREITHFLPVWALLKNSGAGIQVTQEITKHNATQALDGPRTATYDDQALTLARRNGVAILPVIQNAEDDNWDEERLHKLVNSEANRSAVISALLKFVRTNHFQGVNIDFETDRDEDRDGMTAFIGELAAVFHPLGLLVTQDVQLDSGAYALPPLSKYDDFLVPMLYDEHSDGDAAGPIASQGWFDHNLASFVKQVPASKVVIGLGNYGYDWAKGSMSPDSLTFQDACQLADESRDGDDGVIRMDPKSLNPYFTYSDTDANGKEIDHSVWLEDASTTFNELKAAERYKTLGAALWRVGGEDPSIWQFFNRRGDDQLASFNANRLSEVSYSYFGTSFDGQGDILDVVKRPTKGARAVSINEAGYVTGETYKTYPSQYVIRRRGLVDQVTGKNTARKIALTFDDGPDPRWTPRILDILDRYHVKATFFVVGENANANPGLLMREFDDGMEIGNHSFTHPEMDTVSPLRTKLELDATQRVIEAMTGHMTTLFRAPNRADSEPTTEADFDPILQAHNLGYLFVGEQVDPTDWYPGIKAPQIAQYVLSHPNDGNCVLLHDAGGQTREETIKALPAIIEGLRKQGYEFVTVSALTGLPTARVFPAVTGKQTLTVAYDRAFFLASYYIGKTFSFVFVMAILLGIGRILAMGSLALVQSRREKRRTFDTSYQPEVSVVIAAYNEEKVVNKTIETLLSSDYPNLEIIVVDDGSKDRTADVVREKYGHDTRVTVIRKENGGKASALNLGIRQCRGDILVALDADTVFNRDTISKLVRHFADPGVGAVSGNVKVGNRNNPLTIWQAVEYITSQNFDRRAFDLLNCITVVPGAVGAWRRDAVVLAGMYSSQTLAEDTDLTFKVRRLGYRIVTDNEALAYTEAPESLRNLGKQRFRWAFGTLQCLWKHRSALFNPEFGTFGFVAMPSLWIYQIAFQALAPIVDATIVWSLLYQTFIAPNSSHSDLVMLLTYWTVFSAVELLGAAVAFHLDGEDKRLLPWLPLQRFVYRQLMYGVIIKSLGYAVAGSRVGWGKFERKGSVQQPAQAAQETGSPASIVAKIEEPHLRL